MYFDLGDHQRYMNSYLNVYPGKYFTGDGCRRDQHGYIWITVSCGYSVCVTHVFKDDRRCAEQDHLPINAVRVSLG